MGKLVYYYGLISTTIVLLGSFFVPAPYKYLQLAVLAPFSILAWVHFTNPRKVSEAEWSKRMIIVSALLIPIGIGTFHFSRLKPDVTDKDTATEGTTNKSDELIASMSAQISKLQEKLETNKDENSDNNNF